MVVQRNSTEFVDYASGFVGSSAGELDSSLAESLETIEEYLEGRKPVLGVVLGMGLAPVADALEYAVRIPFSDIPHMKRCSVIGHAGQFVCGYIEGTCVIAMQGRLHGYEGYSAPEVAYPVWLMGRLGVKVLVTTYSVRPLSERFYVGDLCLTTDHINLTGRNPLVGHDPNRFARRFVSLDEAYSPRLRRVARDVAGREEITLKEGIYLAVPGPSLETPAEMLAYSLMGAGTVGVSSIEEVIAARHVGIEVLGISLVCGAAGSYATAEEVSAVGGSRCLDLLNLIKGIVIHCLQ